jgi:transposase
VTEVAVGIDVAKEFHWVVATRLDPATGKAVEILSRRVDNNPPALAGMIEELTAMTPDGESMQVGIDILGGIARLLEVMLTGAGLQVVHVPGLAVKTARRATRGGEHKSDPRDARVIADQVRNRDDLREVAPITEADAELALLVSRRRELVTDQTRRINRLRELLCTIAPGIERVIDPTNKIDLALLARYVTPAEIRRAGKTRIANYLRRTGRHNASVISRLVEAVTAAAGEQRLSVPAEALTAQIVRDLAGEALDARAKLAAIDTRLEQALASHPDAALVLTLPGMGAVLTAEFLAVAGGIGRFASGDHLAAAAGLAPALNQSGKVRYLQRPLTGDRVLKRVFYRSAFCALPHDPASRTFYDRKRRQGKTHHQAVIALARRRINVLYAMLRDRQPYQTKQIAPAA